MKIQLLIADLSQLINVNIFSFAYGITRKTINHFGEDNIIDC
jgi:hypothetical protein